MNEVIEKPKNQIALMAERLNIDPEEMQAIVIKTIMPARQQVTNEQFAAFVAVANEYGLNPLTKEIYAFPSKGGIQPIVSIDGWLKLINNRPDMDGLVHEDNNDIDGNLISITCKIYVKGRSHPTTCTEYMGECQGTTEPWKKWPRRMLRHKATIQCARYAFGLSGIIDPDEAERYPRPIGSGTTAKQPEPAPVEKRVEVEPMGEEEGIKFYASIMEMAGNIGDLKNAFTEAHRWYKSIQSQPAKTQLKSFYDDKKMQLEILENVELPDPALVEKPAEAAEQSDEEWRAELQAASE